MKLKLTKKKEYCMTANVLPLQYYFYHQKGPTFCCNFAGYAYEIAYTVKSLQ